MPSSRLPSLLQLSRRALLAAAVAQVPAAPALAQGNVRPDVTFVSWSAALDVVREQITQFSAASGLHVAHQHFPWANYRNALLSRLIRRGPADVVWLSDSWLPEFAQAGWVAPISDIPALTRFNAEAWPICTNAMSWQGQQFGLGYYVDNMAFFYNREILARAGIATPPTTWQEVLDQSRHIQRRSLVEHALALPLAADPWLIEIITALVYSFGGRFIDDTGRPVMTDPQVGAGAALAFLQDAIHHERVLSPAAVEAAETDVLEAFGAGRHAFAILPTYRFRVLNDPAQSPAAPHFRSVLMPNGGNAQGHETCGWVRFYAMASAAAEDERRRANATRFIAAFGGRDEAGNYSMQKRLILNTGQPYCATPLARDPEVQRLIGFWTGDAHAVIRQQITATRPKDTISPWFANWQALTNEVWRAVALDTLTAAAALDIAAEAWRRLRAVN